MSTVSSELPSNDSLPADADLSARALLRNRLLAARTAFAARPEFAAAEAAVSRHVAALVAQLEPECLGLYWPVRSEFNARAAWDGAAAAVPGGWALPAAEAGCGQMAYRLWDGAAPTARDGCGIPTGEGASVVPDVVLVPCVGWTRSGYRLGYGGGYFDRWLSQYPQVTAIGLAWAKSVLDDAELCPAAHDQRLTLIVTEVGVL